MSEVFQPSEQLHPSFRQEDQHMAEELKPVIVGPPAFASPDPATSVGGLLTVEERPASAAVLAADYGERERQTMQIDTVTGTAAESSTDGEGSSTSDEKPREEWNKADWQAQADAYGLAKSGTKDEVQQRVLDYEEEIAADKEMKASEWIEEVDAAEDAEELGSIRERYGLAEADYSTVNDAFEKKQAEFDSDNS